MHITMVKKRLLDGSECRKCQDATATLQARGLWNRIDEIVWADERDPDGPGMRLGVSLGVEAAPFWIVRDADGEAVFISVLQLIRDRFGADVTVAQQAAAIDADDIGGI